MEKNSSTRSPMHRRLLTAGLLAGVSVVAGAGAASAATPTTVDAGPRTPVAGATPVSPAALPVTWSTGTTSERGTRLVDVRL